MFDIAFAGPTSMPILPDQVTAPSCPPHDAPDGWHIGSVDFDGETLRPAAKSID